MFKMLLGSVLLLAPMSVHAEWMRAESRNFVVYEDGNAAMVRDAAERLEKLSVLQHVISGAPDRPAAIKVRVYLLADPTRVQATLPWPNAFVAGYYDVSRWGPYAVNTRSDDHWNDFSAQLVLFHELTHHFMRQYFTAAYPVWYSEGFADFVGATSIGPDNAVTVGVPVVNRYYALRSNQDEQWIPVRSLVSAYGYAGVRNQVDLLYSEGWLLTHYLTLGGTRDGQLARYLNAINAGKSYEAAAQEAFGDLNKLNHELKVYAQRAKLPVKVLNLKAVETGPVTVAKVSSGEAALMMAEIRMNAGIPAGAAADFAADVRKTAARYPDDTNALRLRAEADRLAGDRIDRASALAHWTELAPRDHALSFQRALLDLDTLDAGKVTDPSRWNTVRDEIVAALRLDPANPAILFAYHDSFVRQGIEPTVGAQNGLFRALDIVPQDDEIRYALAADFEKRGFIKDAISVIRPAAYAMDVDVKPRDKARAEKLRERTRLAGIPVHETARDMLTRLEKKAGVGASPTAAE